MSARGSIYVPRKWYPIPGVALAMRQPFAVIELGSTIGGIAAAIRRERRLKLPDAVILATARHLGCPLVTRNTRDFGPASPEVIVSVPGLIS
jgi:predicted nucleic acid-binding protein